MEIDPSGNDKSKSSKKVGQFKIGKMLAEESNESLSNIGNLNKKSSDIAITKKNEKGKLSSDNLINGLISANSKSLDKFIRIHQDKVYSIAYWMLNNLQVLDDVVTTSFREFFARINQSDSNRTLNYLYQITLDLCAEQNSQLKNRSFYYLTPFPPLFGQEGDPLFDFFSKENSQIEYSKIKGEITDSIELSLKNLDDDLKAPIILHDLHSMSKADMAEVLGLELSTAKVRLYRGRTNLLKILKEGTMNRVPDKK